MKTQVRKGVWGALQVRTTPGKSVADFVAAWCKVMDADRYDLR